MWRADVRGDSITLRQIMRCDQSWWEHELIAACEEGQRLAAGACRCVVRVMAGVPEMAAGGVFGNDVGEDMRFWGCICSGLCNLLFHQSLCTCR